MNFLFNYFIDTEYFYYKEYYYKYVLITNNKRKGYILRKYSSISCNKMINENEILYNFWETPLYNKESKLIYYIIVKYDLYNYLNYINLSNYLNNILIINQYIFYKNDDYRIIK